MNNLNYGKVFEVLVKETANYVRANNLKAMVLGISGGIDSTVVAAICYEVSKRTGVPLIGRSLPIKNKDDEFDVSKLVGEAFCSNFKIINLSLTTKSLVVELKAEECAELTPIMEGNIQARLRMMYLYNLASILKGLVMSTDNQTEYQLGFWTIHGDVGDFDPIQDLWKTEVYGLAEWLSNYYIDTLKSLNSAEEKLKYCRMYEAINESIGLTPTDGLGISNSDLEQIGAKSYNEVDDILSRFIPFENFRKSYDSAGQIMHPHDQMAEYDCWSQLCSRYGEDVVNKVWNRHLASEFKRKKAPIYIHRSEYENN